MPTDAFHSIEQRIKMGFLIGFGILLLFHHQLKPWLLTVSAILFSLILGILTARFISIQAAAQNLSVSFSKIIRFLLQKNKPTAKLSQAQLALYYYILHDQKLVPRFQHKIKEIEELTAQYGLHPKNFQLKYNEISNTKGQEGYSKDYVDVVSQLLERNYPSALQFLEELTQHIY